MDLDPKLQSQLIDLSSKGRAGLLPALQAVQNRLGYLPEEAVAVVGRLFKTPLADIHGVIEFYSLLRTSAPGRNTIHVCTDTVCSLQGSERILDAACDLFGISPGETSADGEYTVESSSCLGLCDHAPAVLYNDRAAGQVDPDAVFTASPEIGLPPRSQVYGTARRLTPRCGSGRAADLGEYRAGGGTSGLRRALSLTPGEVIAEIKTAGLVGRGGAAFPTGLKWEGAAGAPGAPKYVVCNADESEPGTFKDRILLEEDPHLTLEGLIIAAYAIGANDGYIYIRGEYPHAYEAMETAVAEAYAAGLLGQDVLGSGFRFDVELRRGAGAYICGEETALFESIEGKRGFPRLKPPFPTTHGLFGKPTAINNVETLANVPYILSHGADEYRRLGTERSPGSKLFCLSGDVSLPGLYEVPFGISLRSLIYDLAGGIPKDRRFQAVLLGGAAGAFAGPDQLDVEMSFEGLRQAGLPLGSGVVMVFDERRDLRSALVDLARFFADESCGKCFPCQIGTRRQLEILERIAVRETLPGDRERLEDVGWTMSDASICGLGQTAASAVLSAMRLWPTLFNERNGQ